MEPFTQHRGLVATLDRSNVDTDQIIPKQFLKRIERTGFGEFLFFDWRFDAEKKPRPDFELNKPAFRGASILVTRRNFGSGSSREHAVWALANYGFRCVIAESFADIFYNNSFKNGLLPVTLAPAAIQKIFDAVTGQPGYQLTVDLNRQTVSDDFGFLENFQVDPHRRHCMLNGLDDIELTLRHIDQIAAYEKRRGMPPVPSTS
jgi:3-isopropylmalate/(R)-2-methylmalate dehydratase small subunit